MPGFARPARAAEDDSPPISLELSNVPLSQVIQLLIANSNVEIVFDDPEGKLADRKVAFIAIRQKSIETALATVCKSADVYFQRDKDGIYHVSARSFTAPDNTPGKSPRPPAGPGAPFPQGPGPVETAAQDKPAPEEMVTDKIVLGFLDPGQAVQMLFSSHMGKRGSGDFRVNSIDDLDIYPGVVDPTTGNWYMPGGGSTLPPIFPMGNRRGVGSPGSTSGNQFGGGGLGGGGFGGGGLGGGGFGGGGLGGGGLGGGGLGGGGLGGGGGGGGTLIPDNIQGILAFPQDNSLLVRGTPEDIQALKNIIRLLDIPPRQISIKIEQIAVQSTFNKQFGIDWQLNFNDIAITAPIGLATGGAINVGILGDNWRVNFSAAVASGKATVIDSLTVTTMNNTPAVLFSGSTSYAFLPQIQQVQGAGLVTSFFPLQLLAANSLTAIPRVNGDGTITMFIPFSLSRFLGESVGPDGTRLPNQTFTSLFAIRRVASGSTIVVGGIINNSDTSTTNGIPILKDLPIVGPLFRNKSQTKNNNESLFFFTPTLLPEAVATGSTEPTGGTR
jgi:general secretion pathway protein D